MAVKMKENFQVESDFGSFYTSGYICWTNDGNELICQNAEKINIVDVHTGKITKTICAEEETQGIQSDLIYTFALSYDNEKVLTAHKSGLLKMWSKITGESLKIWKSSHKGPIAKVVFRPRSSIVASGGSDSNVRIWDYEKKMCTAVFKNCEGVINILAFHPDLIKNQIFAAADDNIINCWDYVSKELILRLDGHFSKITSISIAENFEHLVSVSKDKVLILYNLNTGVREKVVPVYEALESCQILPNTVVLPNGFNLSEKPNNIFAAVAGENGIIQIWDCLACKIIFKQTNSVISKASDEGGLAIVQLLYCPIKNQFCVVSSDHNIIVHDISTFDAVKQLIGFSDEILDMCFVGKKSEHLAVATNSNDIKLYDTTNMNCQILKGHTDIVLSLASHSNFLLSSSKDNSIRLWKLNPNNFSIKCIAKGNKHSASVGCVSFGKLSHKMCASVSQDMCLKIWELPNSFDDENITSLVCVNTVMAHDKDINCVTISPNDEIIATASQDKTVKLWSTSKLQLLGELKGHKRGVWSVRFSPVDQVIMTTSADCTIRLWSVTNFACLKLFEGHDSSVLCGQFLNRGLQILSAGADGLIKLWSIKNGECVGSFENHESRIWAIAIHQDENYFYSGGSDSRLIRWKDVTEEKKEMEFNERRELILIEQELNNLLMKKEMVKSLKLALRLEKPFMTLKIINEVSKNKNELTDVVLTLDDLNKEKLLKHAIEWNTNSKNCRSAQLIFNILMKEILSKKIKIPEMEKLVRETLPYTERHYKRVTEYLKNLKYVEFSLKCMQSYTYTENEFDSS